MSIVPINEGQGNASNSNSNSSLNLWDPNSMLQWDPFMDFHLPLSSPFSNFFPDFGFGSSVNTRLDWKETPRAHIWKIVLPGFTNEDVLVELQDERMLQVSVESGNFMSRFKIPDDGNLHQLKANMINGVLVVTVPKLEQSVGSGAGRNIRVVEIEGTD
ncbi:17.5 kDa class I heat shock protein-like [Vicia villosa]|uniref:17.5 kDa class I heat shock protein-like n=1 Tax=Vicia villosa TaxID=3911 RepID=UPI00273AD3B3|nr:17.5 kDa class I heat shock protein-like [Vicia villosa]